MFTHPEGQKLHNIPEVFFVWKVLSEGLVRFQPDFYFPGFVDADHAMSG